MAQTQAKRAYDFLSSVGMNMQVQSYGAGAPYTNGSGMISDLGYIGVRVLRDGTAAANSGAQLTAMTALANAGFRWTILPTDGGGAPPTTFTFNLTTTIANLTTIDQLASPHALLDVESFNEPINWMPIYNGNSATWQNTQIADTAFYNAAKGNSRLGSLPFWSITEAGSQTSNVGFQFLTIPSGGGGTSTAGGTNIADVFNIHIYPAFNGAVGFYDPSNAPLSTPSGNHDQFIEQWDQDFGPSTLHGYAGNPDSTFVAATSKVVTEFGLSTSQVDARTKAVNMANGYLNAYFKDGFARSFAYELYEEGDGYGFFSTTGSPTTTATYMHNLTVPIADAGATAATFTPGSLVYTLTGLPANSQQALMQKSNGHFLLAIWVNTTNYNLTSHAPIAIGTTNANLTLSGSAAISVFDNVSGTTATQTFASTSSVTIPLSDHAVVIDISSAAGGPESPNNTVVTTVGPTITDASGNIFSISSGAQIIINGIVDTATSNVIELAYVNHVLWQENAAGNWYNYLGSPGSYGGPTTASPLTSTGSGNFRVTGGQIIDPNGKIYVPVGINLNGNDVGAGTVGIASTNSLGQPLTQLFPGINHIRLRTAASSGEGTPSAVYPAPSTFDAFVNQMSPLGIVVEIEDHSCNGGFYEGTTTTCALPQQGSAALVPMTNWYAALATHFKANPYVWFGSMNEPNSSDGTYSTSAISTISNYQQGIYNAVRGTGAANMIQMLAGLGGGNCGTVGASSGFVVSDYATMTNIIWELHAYYSNGDVVRNSGYTNATAYLAGQAGAQCGGSGGSGYIGAQTISSADGLVPVIYGEWGSDDGNPTNGNASQISAAMIAVAQAKGFGNTGWHWYNFSTQWQMVNNGGTPGGPFSLTTWGQEMAAVVAQIAPLSGPTGPTTGPVRVPAPLTGTVTTGNWASYNQTFSGVTLACGKPFHFIALPPAQYNASAYKYPLLIWLHPDHQGDPWYLGQNTDPLFLANDESANFNLVPFRTAYPAVVVAAYADQTNGNGSLNSCNSQADSAVENWGGWVNTGVTGSGTVYSGDTGPNVFALLAMINYLETQYSIDTTRIYVEGFSLGGIGSEYLMQKYNSVNGSPAVFAAASSMAGVLQINGFAAGPNTAQKTAMTNVPVWWFGGANDGASVQSQWNEPMFVALSGGSSAYPPAITSPAANRAGNSQMLYTLCPTCGHQDTDASGNPVWVNTTIMNWMFSINGTPSTGCPPNCTPPPPPNTATTWDPARVPAQMTLSNSNTTATTTATASPNSITVFSTTSYSTGKFCFAVVMTAGSTNWSVGVANNSFPIFPSGSAGLGGDTFGEGFYPVSPAQAIYYAGVQLTAGTTADVTGDEVDECVDLGADLVWVQTPVMRSAGLAWNNLAIGSSDPAAGIGGQSFSGLVCPCYIVFNTMDFPSSATLNAGGPFISGLPSGFAVWAPPASSSRSPMFIQLGSNDNRPSVANDNGWEKLYSPTSFRR